MICNRQMSGQGLKQAGGNSGDHGLLQQQSIIRLLIRWHGYMCRYIISFSSRCYESLNDAMPMISEHANRERLDKLPTIGRGIIQWKKRSGLQVIGMKYVQNGAWLKCIIYSGRRQLTKGIDLEGRTFYTIMIGAKIKMAHC